MLSKFADSHAANGGMGFVIKAFVNEAGYVIFDQRIC